MIICYHVSQNTHIHTYKYSSQFAGDDYEFIINILNVLIITQKKGYHPWLRALEWFLGVFQKSEIGTPFYSTI